MRFRDMVSSFRVIPLNMVMPEWMDSLYEAADRLFVFPLFLNPRPGQPPLAILPDQFHGQIVVALPFLQVQAVLDGNDSGGGILIVVQGIIHGGNGLRTGGALVCL